MLRAQLCVSVAGLLASWAPQAGSEPHAHAYAHAHGEDRIREVASGLFSALDANSNGMLTKIELLRDLDGEAASVSDTATLLGISVESGEKLLQACDADGNRAISELELWEYLRDAHLTEAGVDNSSEKQEADAQQSEEPLWSDANGYVIGCMCQGRFGNQFDYMLSFIEHAKRLNRTAILPPWVEYNALKETNEYPYYPGFSEFFKVESIRRYHRAIDAFEFMATYGSKWRRLGVIGYSASARAENFEKGVPRAGFWKSLGIKFDRFEQLSARARSGSTDDVNHPVLAVDCVPGKYPAPASLNNLARYFEWSSTIDLAATKFIEKQFGHRDQVFVAVQWRQEFAARTQNSGKCSGFSVSQCSPYIDDAANRAVAAGERPGATARPGGYATELCAPSLDSMRVLLGEARAAAGPSAKLFVASDTSLGELGELGELFRELGAVTQEGGE
eukprot:COSAG02_NODE_1365_length_13037_cov_4.315659_2_plen_448_part_00